MPSDAPSLLPLPRDWNRNVQSAVLRMISLARFIIVCARGRAANSSSAAVRLTAEKDQLEQEVALLREELRLKDTRFRRVPSQRRPHYYTPIQRMAIL